MKKGIIGSIFALLFLWSTLANAGVLFFSGYETGDFKEWGVTQGAPAVDTVQVTRGGYSFKSAPSTNSDAFASLGVSATTVYSRFNFYSNAVNTNAAGQAIQLVFFETAGAAIVATVQVLAGANSTGTLNMQILNGSTQIGPSYPISANAWHDIETKLVISATVGIMELKIDGSVVASGSNLNTGSTAITQASVGFNFATGPFTGNSWIDDVTFRNDQYPGPGYTIARQGAVGTPTFTGWTCTALAGGVYQDWSETPFSATNNCSSATSTVGVVQTMLMGSFGASGSGTEGTGTISSSDTINAAKTGLVGKITAGGSTNSIAVRQYVGGSATDSNCTNSATDAFCGGAIWSPTFANLTDGTTELGAVDNNIITAGGTKTAQVEDEWEIVDSQPAPTATPTPCAFCLPNYNIHLLNSSKKIMNGGASAVSGSANLDAYASDTSAFLVDSFTGSASGTSGSPATTLRFVGRGGNVCSGSDSAVPQNCGSTGCTTVRVCESDHEIATCTESATPAPYSASVFIIDANGFVDDTF